MNTEKERGEVPYPAVIVDGVRYEAVAWGKARGLDQNGGYIAAHDTGTGDELWLLKVYTVDYDDELESDKQDLFIADLMLEAPSRLRVTDERGGVYRVDLVRRAVMASDWRD